jgi:hypothetical protein
MTQHTLHESKPRRGLGQDESCTADSQSAASHRLWNEHEVARYLGISVATLRRRRLFRKPPCFIRIGASVRYRWQDIQSFVAGQVHGGE